MSLVVATTPVNARVAEWQTRKIQDLVPARAWRFKSSLAQFLLTAKDAKSAKYSISFVFLSFAVFICPSQAAV